MLLILHCQLRYYCTFMREKYFVLLDIGNEISLATFSSDSPSFKRKFRAMSPRVPAARDVRVAGAWTIAVSPWDPVGEGSEEGVDQERGECRSLGLSSRRRRRRWLLGSATLVPRGHLGRASFAYGDFPTSPHNCSSLSLSLSTAHSFSNIPRLSSRMQLSRSTRATNDKNWRVLLLLRAIRAYCIYILSFYISD